jgi:hypothetical protein
MISFNAWAIDVGDTVEVLSGPDAGAQGVVIKVYTLDDSEAFAVRFSDTFYGLFTESDLKEVE